VPDYLECVINVSEGRDPAAIAAVAGAGGALVLDVHSDPYHHRSVITLCGPPLDVEGAAAAVARAAVDRLDLGIHSGVHPRIGVLDVVPFVALAGGGARVPGGGGARVPGGGGARAPGGGGVGDGTNGAGGLVLHDGAAEAALAARDRFASWAGAALDLPCYLYGPERSLPEVRRGAGSALAPDTGPAAPHPTAGACAVGARPLLVAYNLWLAPGATVAQARAAAAAVRGPGLRTLGLAVGDAVQVSCNLTDPFHLGPGAAHDKVAAALGRSGPDVGPGSAGVPPGRPRIERAELVGLLPRAVLAAEPPGRWAELGIGPGTTIEARLERAGLDGGSFVG
jgi:glutamate formiminotransferase